MQATAQAVEENATGTEQKKLWGGRFTGATDPLMEKFNESMPSHLMQASPAISLTWLASEKGGW